MKNFLKSKVTLIVIGLLFILFNVLFFVLVDYNKAKTALYLAYGFIDLAFVLVGLFAGFMKFKSNSTITAIIPTAYITLCYFVVALVMNIIIMAINPQKVTATILLNVVVLIFALIAFVLGIKMFTRVSDNTAAREARVVNWREISVKVNALTYLTKDEDVIAAIRKIKEDVDYSTSAGNDASKSYEESFVDQIETVSTLLTAKADKEAVLDALDTAANLLKTRNQMVVAGKVR